jgi:homocitrate synthase NifV
MKLEPTTRHVRIIDSTLRDGEQAPGIVFSPAEKLGMARQLAEMGVPEIECGIPAMGRREQREIQALARLGLPCRMTGWCRARLSDLQSAARCGLTSVHIAFVVSSVQLRSIDKDWPWLVESIPEVLREARNLFEHVSVGAQDASRADPQRVREFIGLAARHGAYRVRIADTLGIWTPLQTWEFFRQLRRHQPSLSLEFHGHNDLGMATANTISAIEGGADCASVTVNGLGERAGNAALEQVVMALRHALQIHTGIDTRGLAALSAMVAHASGRPIAEDRPVTGRAAYLHESGIHCSGLLRDRRSYEPFAAEEVGRTTTGFVIGRHSGSAAIRHVLATQGVETGREQAMQVLKRVRALSTRRKGPISAAEVREIHRRVVPGNL